MLTIQALQLSVTVARNLLAPNGQLGQIAEVFARFKAPLLSSLYTR
jgi:hypothetical protein